MKKFALVFCCALVLFSCTKKSNINDNATLNLDMSGEIGGFDPVINTDVPAASQISNVYESLYEYHWLKKPKELIPNLAAEMPKYSDNNLTITIKIKPNVFFQDDPAFKDGIGRELVAEDLVYSIKRAADLKNTSNAWSWIDGKIVGLNKWREINAKKEVTDYNEEVEGLKTIDKHTLQIKLVEPFPQLIHLLATPFYSAVAREVVEKYGKEFLNHPVGTGPYKLVSFIPSTSIKYIANPKFREKYYPTDADPEFKSFLVDAGKKLPLVKNLNYTVNKERSTAWLKFLNKEIDLIFIPKDTFSVAMNGSELSKELKDKNIQLNKIYEPNIFQVGFNMENKVLKNKKLRQALYASIDFKKFMELFTNNLSYPANSGLGPEQQGYDVNFKNPYRGQNLELAKKLLTEAGFPNGKGLPVISYDSVDSTVSRQQAEFYAQQFANIGVKLKLNLTPWPQFLEKLKAGKTELFGVGYMALYPDSQIYLQSLYSKNIGGTNALNYNDKNYDEMYEKARVMFESPERTALYKKMNEFIAEEVPALYLYHRVDFLLNHPRIRNIRESFFDFNYASYLNVNN